MLHAHSPRLGRATDRALRACTAAAAVLALPAPAAGAAPATPKIIGGTPIPITSAPWQVYVLAANPPAACGGSILDATHVLTAGHCVAPAGSTTPRPASDLQVLAGASDTSGFAGGQPPPPGSQVSVASSVRVHPYYLPQPQQITDDVAVITLARAVDLSGPNARAIGLAGAAPPAGSVVSATGYGQQDNARQPDGKLYSTSLTAIGDDDCRQWFRSAVVVCVYSPSSSPCHGDSGGPLTAGSPPVVLGVASFVSEPCGTGPGGYSDVTAPEIRAFIDGAAQVPVAPRQTAPVTTMWWVAPPVDGSPLRCDAGGWSGGPAIVYTFKTDTSPSQVLQTGASPLYSPGAADVGRPIVCVVEASNGGGTTTSRSATSPPILPDRIRPRFVVRSARCSRTRCRVVLLAADSNSLGALRISVSATGCKHRRGCTRKLTVRKTGRTTYRATGRRPRGRKPLIVVRVSDAAGNRARTRKVRAR